MRVNIHVYDDTCPCVCLFVCVYIHIHIFRCTYMYICMYICIYIYVYAKLCKQIYVYAHTHIDIHMLHARIHTYIYVYMFIYIYPDIHTHIHLYTTAYKHTYTYVFTYHRCICRYVYIHSHTTLVLRFGAERLLAPTHTAEESVVISVSPVIYKPDNAPILRVHGGMLQELQSVPTQFPSHCYSEALIKYHIPKNPQHREHSTPTSFSR